MSMDTNSALFNAARAVCDSVGRWTWTGPPPEPKDWLEGIPCSLLRELASEVRKLEAKSGSWMRRG